MERIIYSKFSNDRKKEYALVTKILSKDNELYVLKESEEETAKNHIFKLVEICEGLKKQLLDTDFYVPMSKKTTNGIRMEYVEGKTLEEHFDELLVEGKTKECAEEIYDFLKDLLEKIPHSDFKMTEEFSDVFGEVTLPEGLSSFEWSDIDLIFPNIILSNKGKAIIDYEWTFHFPVPVEYIWFRSLHSYIDYSEKRKELLDYNLYEKLGITEDMIGAFWKMEDAFQSGIYEKSSSLDEFHEKVGLEHFSFPSDYECIHMPEETPGDFLRVIAELESEIDRQVERKMEGSCSIKKLILWAAKLYGSASEKEKELAHRSMNASMYSYDILFPNELQHDEFIVVDTVNQKAMDGLNSGKIVVVDDWLYDKEEVTLCDLLEEKTELDCSLSFSYKNAKVFLEERMKDEQKKTQTLFSNVRKREREKNERNLATKKKNVIFFLVLGVLTVFRIGLQLRLPIGAFPAQYSDDGIMMSNAINLMQGNYLGEYNSYVLTKGISYSLFLVLTYATMIPYGMMLCIWNIISAVVFLRGISPRIYSKKLFAFLYLVLLYLPIGMDRFIGTRIYRIGIMPYFALLVAGCAIGAYLRRDKGSKALLPWLIFEGLFLAFFYNIREDSIWIMPLVFVILIIEIALVFGGLCKKEMNLSKFLKRSLLYLLPILILFGTQQIYKGVNYCVYGIAEVNDRAGSSYADVLEDLYHIDGEIERVDVWVTQEMLQNAIDVSPTLASIEKEIHENMAQWAVEKQVRGDLVGWALREAVAEAGYYKDAVSTEAFYADVHKELTDAFSNGSLKERDGIYLSSQLQATTPKELVKVVLKSLRTMFYDSTYYEVKAEAQKAQGNVDEVRTFERVTGQLAVMTEKDLKGYNKEAITVANAIIFVYRILGFITTLLSVVAYLYLTISLLKKRKYQNVICMDSWLILTGLILSAFVLCFGVMMAMRWFVDNVNIWSAFYTAACFPYIVLFKWLALYLGYKEYKEG
ncbi:MAG: hypothetical protein K5675_07170 [Lachnospiraceae bacterium]|nr:hypothetical protein [Lachnospiraceae bacterium]